MSFKIVVEGDYACFTRPEMKVERVSYDVPTPSALEGLLKSVYWKPAIRYCIDKIVVFNPIQYTNIRRNEVKSKVLLSKVKTKMEDSSVDVSIDADEKPNQRNSMILKNVKYGVEFHFELTGLRCEREKDIDASAKHACILRQRLEKGAHFKIPHLGCREFAVNNIQLVDEFNLSEVSPQNMGDIDLNYMLYGLNFCDGGIPIDGNWDNPVFSDCADAVFYRPHMVNGVIDVEKYRREQC